MSLGLLKHQVLMRIIATLYERKNCFSKEHSTQLERQIFYCPSAFKTGCVCGHFLCVDNCEHQNNTVTPQLTSQNTNITRWYLFYLITSAIT